MSIETGTLEAALAAFENGAADDVAGTVQVRYGGSLISDVALFADSLGMAARAAASTPSPDAVSPVAEVMMEPLDMIDREAASLGEQARVAMASDEGMSPAEIVDLTMRSQEFMFHSQLTANVANRTADGLQQLFRQQG